MSVTTRQGLIDYCLRALGHPMIQINVDESQLEDRVDEALDYFRLYHYDGIEKVYLKHRMTNSTLDIITNNSADFVIGKKLTGNDSGATALVSYMVGGDSMPSDVIWVRDVEGTFTSGETVSTDDGVTAVLAENPLTLGDIDNRFLPLSDWIYGVNRVIPFTAAGTSRSMFDLQYQLRLHDLYDLTSTSLIYYKMMMNHLALLDFELNAKPDFRFNRLNNRLYIDISWQAGLVKPGEYIIVECYRALNPADAPKMYGEPWLKRYLEALIKRQWGTNLKKFSGMQLPGGIVIDGNALYNEAIQEQKDLEDEIMAKSAPLEFLVG